MKKKRADHLLCESGQAESVADAAVLIMEGRVRSKPDTVVRKPSDLLPEDIALLVDGGHDFVSRGALKLRGALDKFAPDLHGRVGIDIGAATGGFTDLMLARGADKVYAVDVGRGLLHWKLRTDPHVVCLEGINARDLPPDTVPGGADVLSMDVSFISATKILPAADRTLKRGALAFVLVKPQFEAPRAAVPPGGVVTDSTVRRAALDKVCAAAAALGWRLLEAVDSPLRGLRGNLEYVAVFQAGTAQKKLL